MISSLSFLPRHAPFPLPCDCLRAEQTHQVKKFEVEGATLSFPLEGEFRYRENEKWHRVIPGEIMVVPNARSIDIEYAPSEQSGEFVALSVVLAEEQLEAAAVTCRTTTTGHRQHRSHFRISSSFTP